VSHLSRYLFEGNPLSQPAFAIIGIIALLSNTEACAERTPVQKESAPPAVVNRAPSIPYQSTLNEGVPHILQKPDFCGEACAAMMLQKLGETVVPKALVYGEIAAGYTNADFAQHVMKLRSKVPPGFSTVVEPPFVVLGDESQDTVHDRAATTIRWTIALLKQDFFSKDPDDILDIWLFKDDASYRKYAKQIFGDEPDTPYGYYSERHGALIMNIATGGGTLVHEIVHPFIQSNFPTCPAWFNEGLGSLYEACAEKNGHIQGIPNWRLLGLKNAVNAQNLPSFKDLTATTDAQFYGQDPGTNYAQARYLLYFLQEQGLLISYYHSFFENRTTDPTGYQTLKKILKEADMDGFKSRWEHWVLAIDETTGP
jgi:hypothetical protein